MTTTPATIDTRFIAAVKDGQTHQLALLVDVSQLGLQEAMLSAHNSSSIAVLDAAELLGVKPDTKTHNAVLNRLCDMDDADSAARHPILTELQPDATTVNNCLPELYRLGKVSLFRAVLEYFQPGAETLKSIYYHYPSNCSTDQLDSLIDCMADYLCYDITFQLRLYFNPTTPMFHRCTMPVASVGVGTGLAYLLARWYSC